MNIQGKLVLITGASSGIGKATAILFAQKGAKVILQARSEETLNEIVNQIQEHGGEAFAYSVDVSDHTAVIQAAKNILTNLGTPDIIVNNAGMGQWRSIEETSMEDAKMMMDVPYMGAFYTTRAFIEPMLERNSGHIINMTSAVAFFSFQGAVAYTAARWAVRGFSEALRTDLLHTNLKVSLIAPGKVDSPYFTNNPGSVEKIPRISDILYKTLTPEEVAQMIFGLTQRYRKVLIRPWLLSATIWFQRFMPWVIEKLVTGTGIERKDTSRETIAK